MMKQQTLIPDSGFTDHQSPNSNPKDGLNGGKVTDLGNGSDVVYLPRFLTPEKSWEYLHYLNKHIPWTRPTIRVFGKPCVQVNKPFQLLIFTFIPLQPPIDY